MGWLTELREAAGYTTILSFCDALNEAGLHKTDATLSVWENQNKLPSTLLGSPDALQKFANVLNISVTELLQKSGFVTDLDLDANFPPEVLRLAHRLNALRDDTLRLRTVHAMNEMLDVIVELESTKVP